MNRALSKTVILACAMSASVRAATIDGTVTNKTTGKPSPGDKVVLVDLNAGMADASTATTDPEGKYALRTPGTGSYLIRVDHQGASYFIAAPQNGSPADITVYDVAAKLEEVGIDADMLLVEAGQGTLHVRERYLVRNASSPPRTQFSENTFEVVLPDGAILEESAATRPGGMGTRTHLIPLAQKGHYSFNVPIQPDQGEKETIFEVAYHFPYDGHHTFSVHPIAPVDHLVVYTAKGIEFVARSAARFKAAQEGPKIDTHVAVNLHSGDEIAFDISGEGRMPPDAGATRETGSATQQSISDEGAAAPIVSADAFSGARVWLLAGLAVLSIGTAFLLLYRRKLATTPLTTSIEPIQEAPNLARSSQASHVQVVTSGSTLWESGVLLDTLKDELFTLEQDKISGRVSPEEYANVRAGLEAVMKRALNTRSS